MSVENELWKQEVLQNELETIRVANGKVYKQQPGSHVYFLMSKVDALAACKLEQAFLKRQLKPTGTLDFASGDTKQQK